MSEQKVSKFRERRRVRSTGYGKSLTQTQHAKNANINNVVKRFTKTGQYTTGFGESALKPQFGVWTNGSEYYEQLCRVSKVKSEFAQLPAQVRQAYRNRPEMCIDFLSTINMGVFTEDMKTKVDTALEHGLIDAQEHRDYNNTYNQNYVNSLNKTEENISQPEANAEANPE